jgi:hypothetical protein
MKQLLIITTIAAALIAMICVSLATPAKHRKARVIILQCADDINIGDSLIVTYDNADTIFVKH